jgi:hypothetical protein
MKNEMLKESKINYRRHVWDMLYTVRLNTVILRSWPGLPACKIGCNLGCQHLWGPEILNTYKIIVYVDVETAFFALS